MSIQGFLIVIGLFIALMLVFKHAGRFIKKLDPKTIKTINWAGFIIAAAGGLAWYFLVKGIFMVVTFLGIIIYFLFYDYDSEEKKG